MSHLPIIDVASLATKGRATGAIQTDTSTPGAFRISADGMGWNIGEWVVLLLAVGDEGSGRSILQQTAECGIDVSHALVDADRRAAAWRPRTNTVESRGSPSMAAESGS